MLAEAAEKVSGNDTPISVLVASAATNKAKGLVDDALSKGATAVFGDLNSTEACNDSS